MLYASFTCNLSDHLAKVLQYVKTVMLIFMCNFSSFFCVQGTPGNRGSAGAIGDVVSISCQIFLS